MDNSLDQPDKCFLPNFGLEDAVKIYITNSVSLAAAIACDKKLGARYKPSPQCVNAIPKQRIEIEQLHLRD